MRAESCRKSRNFVDITYSRRCRCVTCKTPAGQLTTSTLTANYMPHPVEIIPGTNLPDSLPPEQLSAKSLGSWSVLCLIPVPFFNPPSRFGMFMHMPGTWQGLLQLSQILRTTCDVGLEASGFEVSFRGDSGRWSWPWAWDSTTFAYVPVMTAESLRRDQSTYPTPRIYYVVTYLACIPTRLTYTALVCSCFALHS